jgi:cation diffusion facilitator family transporter
MERFFWSLLAAVGIFVAGAGFSAFQAYRSFTMGASATEAHYYLINYAVVAAAAFSEGTSWLRAVLQLRDQAASAGQSTVQHLRDSSDPSVKTVASEDTAALVGLVIAALGLALHEWTGAAQWEGVSSALVAVLLVVVAITLGRDSKDLLIGEAAIPELTHSIRDYLDRECPEVDEVVDLLTMHIGVNQVMLAARIDLADGLNSTSIEDFSLRVDREIQERWPAITHVFIDPTRRDEDIARPGLTR